MHHDPTFWLLARASGLTAYAVLTTSVLAGLVLKSRPFARLKPAAVTDAHRALALAASGAGVMRWVLVTAAAVAAVVAVNVALLSYGGRQPDRVGRLTPIASMPASFQKPANHPVQAPPTPAEDD